MSSKKEEKEFEFIYALKKMPELERKGGVKKPTSKAVQEFVASGLDYAEVNLERLGSKTSVKGAMIGLGKAISVNKLIDKVEVRKTKDGKVVLIKKKKE